MESAVQIEAKYPDSIFYQHRVFCQTGLPYCVYLEVQAGRALYPERDDFMDIGLRWETSAETDPRALE